MGSLLFIFSIVVAGILICVLIVSCFRALDSEKPHELIFAILALFGICGFVWTQNHEASYKTTMIAIAKENVIKVNGTFIVKYFAGCNREYKTSNYSEVKYFEAMDSNEFLKVCIKFDKPKDIYGIDISGGYAKVIPCDSTLAQ